MKIKELLRKIPGPINLYGILRNNFLFDPKRRGFHGDRIYQGIIEQIISSLPVTSFIETGTYVGNSTAYVAAKNETLPVLSCENDKRFYRKSVKRLKKFKNVKIYLKSSEQFIEQILGESQIGNLPFFFLDAHWYKYWPLEDEIRLISKSAISTIIIIDDFKVPQQSHFSFDAQEDSEMGNKICGLELILPKLFAGNHYDVLFPHYSKNEGDPHRSGIPLRGHIVIFQNLHPEFIIFKKNPFVVKYYHGFNLKNKKRIVL